jgi:hypothetical protein
MGVPVKVPSVKFQWLSSGETGIVQQPEHHFGRANPIAESMRLTIAGLDEKQDMNLRLRNPRPIEYWGSKPNGQPFDPTFLMTDPAAWREREPFGSDGKPPRIDQHRSGQVSIGVAVEAPLPENWQAGERTVRVAAIGHGGVFIGKQLSPAQEKLLADTCNWLLGRDDLLNRKGEPWQFPRADLSSGAKGLWQWGMLLGLPLVCGFVGIVVLMKRSLR